MRTASLAAATAALSLALVAPGIASAACTTQNTYKANTTGEWQTDANWSTGTAPTSAQDACIPATSTVTLAEPGVPTANKLTVEGTLRFRTDPGFQSTQASFGDVDNSGLIEFTSTGNQNDETLLTIAAGKKLTNRGTLRTAQTNSGRVVIYGDVDNAAGGSLQVNSKLTVTSLSQAVEVDQRRRRHRRGRHRVAVRQRARFDVRADRGHVHQQRRNDLQPVHRRVEGHGRHVHGHAAAAASGLARGHRRVRHRAHPVRERDARR